MPLRKGSEDRIITSLMDKGAGKEMMVPGSCGDLLQVFVDRLARHDHGRSHSAAGVWDLKDLRKRRGTPFAP
jgi:hypothetical protein